MTAKAIFLCASALLVQVIAGQCIRPASLSSCGCGSSYGASLSVPSSGGGFPVMSSSPINPNGVSVLSENNIEGKLDVCGKLPFVSAVALQGQVPSGGQAGVQYSCGNGNVGITSAGSSNGLAGINSLSQAGSRQGCAGCDARLSSGCGCGRY